MTSQLPEHLKSVGLSWSDKTCVKLTDNNSLFRYFLKEYTEEVRELFKSGLIDNLTGRGLLQPAELRETGIKEYPLVIEHPFIHRISYPFEWPALALKEVALTILEIEGTANRYGYSLYDPNPFNVTIQNGRPIYLDYGSFVPLSGTPIWQGYDKAFRDTILYPLELYERKLNYVARLILREIVSHDLDSSTRRLAHSKFHRSLLDKLVIAVTNRGEITSDRFYYRIAISFIDKILGNKVLKNTLEGITYKVRPVIRGDKVIDNLQTTDARYLKVLGSRAKFLKRLRKKVESLKVSEGSSHWSKYYQNIIGAKPPWERESDLWTIKEHNIYEITDELKPKTALDIGANTGWFSIMLAHSGASVISFDRDEESINQLYSYVGSQNLDVLPLIMDIRQPSPEYELNIGTIAAATERCRSELVMALAVIHHMVSTQRMTLEHLVNMLDKFTEKYLLVEFVPVNESLYKLPSLTDENWNVEVIKEAFDQLYNYEGIWDSFPEGRKLLLFTKKNIDRGD